jgi:hypothetical protein
LERIIMDKPTPSQGQSLRDLSDSIARQRACGVKPGDLTHQLIERGWPEVTARQFVANAAQMAGALREQSAERRAAARPHKQRALRGLFCILLGFAIIVVGLNHTDASAGLYCFAMGVLLCIFESIDCLAGLTGWWRHRH